MDGLLIDSEDIYTLASNEILHKYNRPSLPWSIKAQLQGRPGPESSQILHSWAQLPISAEEYNAELAEVQKRMFPSAQPLPGAMKLLQTLQQRGVKCALATSSHAANYRLKTEHLEELFSLFSKEQIVKGDDERIPKGRGKPWPDIYLLALETVNETVRKEGKGEKEVRPEECLVFEDSVPGIESGRRAGMRVLWCPHVGLVNEFTGREAEVLAGKGGFNTEEEKDAEDGIAGSGVTETDGMPEILQGWPGKLDDGWGEQVMSLEDFDYARYGIKA
ncbi:Pseudouridine-5'-phosphatase [Agyrium rufum]|nr:Pseudouridine-5'-phosphatase [Agyrium rufum]